MAEFLVILLFISLCLGLVSGFPVAFVLAGISLLFAFIGHAFEVFDYSYLIAFPNRIFGIMMNDMLLAVPLFVFMGVMLERSKIAEELLHTMAGLFGNLRAGLGISVIAVGAVLAASTGIVGATVVTMGLISLPIMLKSGYCPKLSTGAICAAGTLGQIIPPSIVLVLLADQIGNAYQTAQMSLGNFSADPVSVSDLFVGAIIPGLGLVVLYILWFIIYSFIYPEKIPAIKKYITPGQENFIGVLKVLLPPLLLILLVLGSILTGFATATESAAVGAVGALALSAYRRKLTKENLKEATVATAKMSTMVFSILIGATLFALVFRGLGGDDMVHEFLTGLPGGLFMALLVTMIVIFLLGFIIDFIEIVFIVVPIVAPVLLTMGADPIWLAIMMAVNLQTSFLTPPFGFALFYLKGVAPKSVKTMDIYKGIIPFVCIQVLMVVLIASFPKIATWLPNLLYAPEYIR